MARADEALAASIGVHAAPATLRVFALLTHLGDPAWLALLGAGVALWLWSRRQRALALGWVLALGGNALLNPALKRIFERVRPLHEHGLVSEMGFSFPSGHTSGATVAYGMLAYVALRTCPRPGTCRPCWAPPRWPSPSAAAASSCRCTTSATCSPVLHRVAAWLVVCVMSVELSRRPPEAAAGLSAGRSCGRLGGAVGARLQALGLRLRDLVARRGHLRAEGVVGMQPGDSGRADHASGVDVALPMHAARPHDSG